jgi:hypothetical protein
MITTALLAQADDWSAPATEMASRIVGKVGPGSAVALNINSKSSLSAAEVRSITSQLESQLRAARMDMVPAAQAVANINITLSENAQGYLWVAEIRQGSGNEIVMQRVARQQSADMRDSSALTLRRRLLAVQDEPILDVELRPDSAVVLSPTRVTWYSVHGAEWQELQTQPLTYRRAMPRDLRGRLWSNTTAVLGVSLPGVRCTQVATGGASLSCAETDDPWPVYAGASIGTEAFFSPVRNFFNGTVAFYDPQKQTAGPASYTVPPFYSVASTVEDGLPLWLFAGIDGNGAEGVDDTGMGIRYCEHRELVHKAAQPNRELEWGRAIRACDARERSLEGGCGAGVRDREPGSDGGCSGRRIRGADHGAVDVVGGRRAGSCGDAQSDNGKI